MGHADWQGHKLRSLVAGHAEHHSLVASSAGVNAHGDIWRLLVNGKHHAAAVAIKTASRVGVSDIADGLAHKFVDFNVTRSGQFARDHCNTVSDESLDCHSGCWVLFENRIEDRI